MLTRNDKKKVNILQQINVYLLYFLISLVGYHNLLSFYLEHPTKQPSTMPTKTPTVKPTTSPTSILFKLFVFDEIQTN